MDILASSDKPQSVLGETGLSEWYGSAPFEHPTSAPPQTLKTFFPAFDINYEPAVAPSRTGETIAQLHDRVALALDAIIKRCDELGVRAVLLCSHAATIIAIGRVLTGNMPENIETEDFRAFTCGLSVYTRKSTETASARNPSDEPATAPSSGSVPGDASRPQSIAWKNGRGVGGGWICQVNSDCSFLSAGEERGWCEPFGPPPPFLLLPPLTVYTGVFPATRLLLAANRMRPARTLEWSLELWCKEKART